MKFVLAVLTQEEVNIEQEIERLEGLKGHPNEKLRQVSLDSNKKRLNEILEAKRILLEKYYEENKREAEDLWLGDNENIEMCPNCESLVGLNSIGLHECRCGYVIEEGNGYYE